MIVSFLFALSGGVLAALGCARLSDIAWKFIRLVGFLTLSLTCIAAALVYQDMHSGSRASGWFALACSGLSVLGAIVLATLAPFMAQSGRFLRAASAIGGIAGVAASVLTVLTSLTSQEPSFPVVFFVVLGQLLGCWLLGSITVAWLLGHAYLTATKMTIAPLRFFANMLSAAVAARFLFFVFILAWAWLTEPCSPASLCTRVEGYWLIALLRVGVGLVGVSVFAYMVRDCVRLRSTQSATGILYFGSLMAYVGELASQYLTRELAWPL